MTSWSVPARRTLRSDTSLEWVDWGVLSPFTVERLDERRRRVTGAVYAQDRLVPRSQRLSGYGEDLIENGDPDHLLRALGTIDHPGAWLYGGHWMNQFGHFVTETLTNLWPSPSAFRAAVFHPFIFGRHMRDWQRYLVARAGWSDRCVVVDGPAAFEALAVPRRAFDLNHSASVQALEVWRRVAFPSDPTHLTYLSRSRLPGDGRSVEQDEELDNVLRDLGFDVVHPEELDIAEQLHVVAESRVIAGLPGSALHLSAFAGRGTAVLEIGDPRSPRTPLPNQLVIDEAIGRRTAFVPLLLDAGARDAKATGEWISQLLTTLPPERGPGTPS